MERIKIDSLFRRFVDIGIDDPMWDYPNFSTNRDRLSQGDIAAPCRHAVAAAGQMAVVEPTLLCRWYAGSTIYSAGAEGGRRRSIWVSSQYNPPKDSAKPPKPSNISNVVLA